MASSPFGTYSFGWNYWQNQSRAKRQAEAVADFKEAVYWSVSALLFVVVAYAWIVLLFCL